MIVAKKKRKGFSLLELLVAVTVVGILGAIVLTSGASSIERARQTTAMQDFEDFESAFISICQTRTDLVQLFRKEQLDALTGGAGDFTAPNAVLGDVFNEVLKMSGGVLDESDGLYHKKDPWGGEYIWGMHPFIMNTSAPGEFVYDKFGIESFKFNGWRNPLDVFGLSVVATGKGPRQQVGLPFREMSLPENAPAVFLQNLNGVQSATMWGLDAINGESKEVYPGYPLSDVGHRWRMGSAYTPPQVSTYE